MSLKHFHLFFIGVAILITAGFGAWALREYVSAHHLPLLMLGTLSLGGTVSLIAYLFWFMRKAKTLPE